ncbi:MAG: hypothetical protein LUE86_06945 [Clostridiales bacterium]|nr:hypothetical protein [Clostridiales bacterium]
MERKSRKTGKGRFQALWAAAIACLFLSGCSGSVNAGTKPRLSYPTVASAYGQYADATWFNGEEEKQAKIMVSEPVPEALLPDDVSIPDTVLDLTPDLCSRWYVQMNIRSGDADDIRPVYAADSFGHTMVRNGEEYRASGYRLDDNWYAFYVPNGTADFSVCAANVIFSEADTDGSGEAAEDQQGMVESGEETDETETKAEEPETADGLEETEGETINE